MDKFKNFLKKLLHFFSKVWDKFHLLYVLIGLSIGFVVVMIVYVLITEPIELFTSIVPEAIGIAFTVFFLDRIYKRRDEEELKRRLVREAGSRSNETAKTAIDWIRYKKWLTGVTALLKNAHLANSNLKEANLRWANLEGAILWNVDFEGADLQGAILEGAYLNSANLKRAYLNSTKLKRANLESANLEGAELFLADLEGADLQLANLEGANLQKVNFLGANLAGARLPDGMIGELNTTMERFTDIRHPKFNATLEEINKYREKMNITPLRGIL